MPRPTQPSVDDESRPATPEELFLDPGDTMTPGPCAGPMTEKECHPIPDFAGVDLF